MKRVQRAHRRGFPWWVLGPDIHGPVLYRRCQSYEKALRYSRYLGGGLTIVRVVVHGDRDILADKRR